MSALRTLPLTALIDPDLLDDARKRLDPFYYCNVRSLPKIESELVLLKDICNINPKREIKELANDAPVPYVGLPDTDVHTAAIRTIQYRSYEKVKGRNIIFEDDVLFARIEPSIYNRKYIYVDKLPHKQKYAFTSGEFHVLEAKPGVNPKYVFWIIRTDFVYNQVFGRVKGTTGRRRVDKSELELFRIPFPSPEIREKLVNTMETAHSEKTEKMKKSRELIEGISAFVLEQLGLKLQSARMTISFWVNVQENSQSRLDVKYYDSRYSKLLNAIQSSHYEVQSLKQISKAILTGQRPKGGVKYIHDGVPSVGGEHITSEGDFNFEHIRYIPKNFHHKLKNSSIRSSDILVVKDGATTGKVAIVSEHYPFKESNINEHVFKIEIKECYNPYYVFSYLFSSLGQEQIKRVISGAAQKGITRQAIENLKIIVPPSEIQDRIGKQVKNSKENSSMLQQEAQEVAERAKYQVEKMIVGP